MYQKENEGFVVEIVMKQWNWRGIIGVASFETCQEPDGYWGQVVTCKSVGATKGREQLIHIVLEVVMVEGFHWSWMDQRSRGVSRKMGKFISTP